MKIVTIEDFRRWLQRFPKDAVVGRTKYPAGCPYRECMMTHNKGRDLRVFEDTARFTKPEYKNNGCLVYYDVPLEITAFIKTLDKTHEDKVTAAQCLAILDQIGDVPDEQPHG